MTFLFGAVFAIGLITAFVLTRFVRKIANDRGWVSHPDRQHHAHLSPLPRLGGVAVAIAFFVASLSPFLLQHFGLDLKPGFTLKPAWPIFVGSLVILLVGAWDDIKGLGPYTKLAVESVAGLILYAGGVRFLHTWLLFGDRQLPWDLDLPLTLLWVLGITNAFNLIDGIDGLAAGSALFSTAAVLVVAMVTHASLASFMTIALSAAILGFLHYNFNPATIFLGDSGSLFIGFMLSALALQSAEKAPTMLAVAIPVVSFGLPILETVLSVLRRLIAGRPVFSADLEHIHHKLLARGFSQRQVLVILYGVSAIFALFSLFVFWPNGGAIGLVFLVLGGGVWIGVQHLGYPEFGEIRRVARRTIDQRRIFINDVAVRRSIEQLHKVHNYDHLYSALVSAFNENDFDGFELWLTSPLVLPHGAQPVQVQPTADGGACLRWKKPGSPAWESSEGWRLSLDVGSSGNEDSASMTIYRHYNQHELQFDVNLLTGEFPQAVAQAISRARVGLKRVSASASMRETNGSTENVVAEAS